MNEWTTLLGAMCVALLMVVGYAAVVLRDEARQRVRAETVATALQAELGAACRREEALRQRVEQSDRLLKGMVLAAIFEIPVMELPYGHINLN